MSRAISVRTQRVILCVLVTLFLISLPFNYIITYEDGKRTRCFNLDDLIDGPRVIDQTDPELIETIKEKFIFYPSYYETFDPNVLTIETSSSTAGTVSTTNKVEQQEFFGQINQSAIIDSYLNQKTNGFFIEAGAFDGEYLSNSIFFEKQRNWTGLLVEPNRKEFRHLLINGKRKKSHASNVCLSIHNYPESMTFDSADVYGGVIGEDSIPRADILSLRSTVKDRKLYKIQCLPLYSLLLALGNPTVDFFSLDVEGAEFGVLKTIPFDKVDIRTLSIEVAHSEVMPIRNYMKKNGYRVFKRLKTDIIFVKDDEK